MAQKQDRSGKQIEELNNRIFLLEDRVDTSRVAMQRRGSAPRLPVIRLRPTEDGVVEEERTAGEPRAAEEPPAADAPRTAARSVVEDRAVEYSGKAKQNGGPRPMLRLYGSRSPERAAAPSRLRGPDPSTVTEKLPVVPLPSRKLARRAAAGDASLSPMRMYKSALSKYRTGKYSAAADAFQSFVKRYTRHEYADNALYWLGECFYDMHNYRLALKMFRRVVEEFPTGNKAPDALLKMGYSFLKLKEKANARTVLAQLVESFPRSQVARLASEALVKIQ